MFDDPGIVAEMRDAKTKLQEWAQGRGLPAPAYCEMSRSGPAHAPHFVIEAAVEGLAPETGEGGSKREAEQDAAAKLLARVVT
jgi:ribonuclease-3